MKKNAIKNIIKQNSDIFSYLAILLGCLVICVSVFAFYKPKFKETDWILWKDDGIPQGNCIIAYEKTYIYSLVPQVMESGVQYTAIARKDSSLLTLDISWTFELENDNLFSISYNTPDSNKKLFLASGEKTGSTIYTSTDKYLWNIEMKDEKCFFTDRTNLVLVLRTGPMIWGMYSKTTINSNGDYLFDLYYKNNNKPV
jgi:hypothetical protein